MRLYPTINPPTNPPPSQPKITVYIPQKTFLISEIKREETVTASCTGLKVHDLFFYHKLHNDVQCPYKLIYSFAFVWHIGPFAEFRSRSNYSRTNCKLYPMVVRQYEFLCFHAKDAKILEIEICMRDRHHHHQRLTMLRCILPPHHLSFFFICFP